MMRQDRFTEQAQEVLATEAVYQAVRSAFPHAQERNLELKGIKEPVQAYALT